MGITMDVYPNLIMLLRVDQGRNVQNFIPHLSLLGLEEIVEFEETHHLTSAIIELNKNNTFIFQQFPVVVILFLAQILVLCHILVIFLDIVMHNVPISEEILDLKSIQFLLILHYFHGSGFSLLSDECSGRSLLKDAYLWYHKLDLPGQLIHEVELIEEGDQKFLFFTLGKLRLMIGE